MIGSAYSKSQLGKARNNTITTVERIILDFISFLSNKSEHQVHGTHFPVELSVMYAVLEGYLPIYSVYGQRAENGPPIG
jgi:hypothetical protein